MSQKDPMLVRSKDGLRGRLVEAAEGTQNHDAQVLIQFDNGSQIWVPTDVLQMQQDSSYYLPLTLAELQGQETVTNQQQGEPIVLPLIAEELEVQKRKVASGGVRINKVVHEREEVVDVPLLSEEVNVERIPINQIANGPVQVRYEGDTMIIPILEEVLVVQKQLMVKEELRVTKRQVTTNQPQTVTLRTEEAIIDRVAPQEQLVNEGGYSS